MSEQIKVPLIPECASCTMSSLKTMVPLLTPDFDQQAKYFALAFRALSEGYSKKTAPVLLSISIYQHLYRVAGAEDPYAAIKMISKEAALRVLPIIERRLAHLNEYNLLRACVASAITGNVIDFNTEGHEPNLEKLAEVFDDVLEKGFAVDDSDLLWKTLNQKQGRALFLADNAGEVILDIPLLRLVRSLGWSITFVVKGRAMINDATMDDVRGTEIENLAEIASSGAWAHGVPLKYVSEEFLSLVAQSDLVISKGQANIETFPEIQDRSGVETYYITRAKCQHISRAIGATKGDNVILRWPRATS